MSFYPQNTLSDADIQLLIQLAEAGHDPFKVQNPNYMRLISELCSKPSDVLLFILLESLRRMKSAHDINVLTMNEELARYRMLMQQQQQFQQQPQPGFGVQNTFGVGVPSFRPTGFTPYMAEYGRQVFTQSFAHRN